MHHHLHGAASTLICPTILSGGAGSRLWPLSSAGTPKQFHAIDGVHSLISQTAERLRDGGKSIEFLPPIAICAAEHVELVRHHLKNVGLTPALIVAEPMGRNTAAAAVMAAELTAALYPGALSLICPADHRIERVDDFHAALVRAAESAHERIVTLGIVPTRAECGYGYIRKGRAISSSVFEIDSFVEKPSPKRAEALLADGGYLWNAGIFLSRPEVLLSEFKAAPRVLYPVRWALEHARRQDDVLWLDAEDFAQVDAMSVDKAVMENTRLGAVTPCDMGWADLGSWEEVWRLAPHDVDGNAAFGPAYLIDARNSLVRSDGPTVCVIGVDDLIVVATKDGVIVLPRGRSQDVKEAVTRLNAYRDSQAQEVVDVA